MGNFSVSFLDSKAEKFTQTLSIETQYQQREHLQILAWCRGTCL